MNIDTLPKPVIIRSLYQDYYKSTRADNGNLISSFWKEHNEKARVFIDDHGEIQSLMASGIGDITGRNIFKNLLHFASILSYWVCLPHKADLFKLLLTAHKVCRSMSVLLSYDCFRQVCALELILRHLAPEKRDRPVNFLILGDGYGFLSSLVRAVMPNATMILIDIGQTLLFQAVHCQKVFPELRHHLVDDGHVPAEVDFLYCPAEKIEKLNGVRKIDIAVNIASMQEMSPEIIKKYFLFLRKNCTTDNLFYCCNRETKTLPGGEVIEFRKYPWRETDRFLVDSECPWYRYFINYPTSPSGPRLCGIRIPLVNYFDGKILHRLAAIETDQVR